MPTSRRAFLITLVAIVAVTAAYGQKPVPKPQESFATYWTSEPGWDTELQLKSNLAFGSLTVTPVLRLASGEEIPLDPVTIASNVSVSVWVNEGLLAHSPSLLSQPGSFGSVVFRFTSLSATNLYATSVPSIHGEPIVFPVRAHPAWQPAGAPLANGPGSLEGIWWQPRAGLNDFLVISNSSEKRISGTLSLFDASGKRWSEALVLTPHQTQRLSTSDLLQKAALSGSYGGIKIDLPASAGAVDGVHFMYDEASKFSALLEMSSRDPNATLRQRAGIDAKQWTMRAPMLALRVPDPAAGLPVGIVLQPMIFVRNTTAKNISADLSLSWRSDSAKGQVKLLAMQLAPFATQQMQIGVMQKQLGVPDNAHWALVTLTTNASPDDLIAVASSRDASGRYGFETRFMGGSGGHFAGGEWRYDANHNQIVSVTNSGIKPTDALLTLHYDNGEKQYEMQQTIQPGDQMWVSLAQLVRQRVPDRKGNTLPVDVSSVTYDLRDLTPRSHSLTVGELAVGGAWGVQAVQPACPECCGQDVLGFSPDPVDLTTGDTDTVAIDGIEACNGDPTVLTPDFTTWGSDNTGVAKVSSAKVQAVAAGSTTGYADGLVQVPGACACNFVPAQTYVPIAVTPTISSVSPAQGLVGTGIAVTITGTGFASGATVSAGSNISVSSVSVTSSTQITATFTPTNSTVAGGNQAVTVTVAGQKSNSSNFYDQVPTDSQIVSTLSNFAMNTGTSPACPSGQAGWYRKVQKITTDQNSPAGNITANGATISESLGLTGPNQLNLAPPTPFAPVLTSGGGYLDDQFGFCSAACPGSTGQSDLSEVFTDQPPSGGSYTLKAHTLVYACTGDTDNGQ